MSVSDTLTRSWFRGRGRSSGLIKDVVNPFGLDLCIPIEKRGTFIPSIAPQNVQLIVTSPTFIPNNYGNTIVMHIPIERRAHIFKTLSTAFTRRFLLDDLQRCYIGDKYYVTIGGKMILDDKDNPLLICGHECSTSQPAIRTAFIDTSVYWDTVEPQISTFIKNTVFKCLAVDGVNIRVFNLKEMVIPTSEIWTDPSPEEPVLNALKEDADKIFYTI